MMSGLATGWLMCGVAFVLSALLTRGAIVYAHRRGMLDEPGYRRSHRVSTPRGGGIGLVVGALAAFAVAFACLPANHGPGLVVAWGVAGLWIAATGWVDDHRALAVLPRLVMQVLATTLFCAALIHAGGATWAWLPLWVLAGVWSVNLHNFMDGIDAILGLQVLFVGAGLGVLAWFLVQPPLALAAFGLAAAAAGFLLFNWPPARIFMGDVGSGFAGFMLFALVLALCSRVWVALWPALVLCSAFVVDAGLTLAWRMWQGKRWYTAHREHLYQWLVRCGWTHAQAGCFYMLWNLLLAAPFALWACLRPSLGPWLCVAVYAVAALGWWQARQACLRRVRRKGERHAT